MLGTAGNNKSRRAKVEVEEVEPAPMFWVYHPTEKAEIVDEEEYAERLENGWYDSPAKFPKQAQKGIASTDTEKTDKPKKKKKVKEIEKEADVNDGA